MNEPKNLLRSIFNQAVELPDPSQRAAFLQQACRGDEDLLRKVEALLQAHDQTSGPLDQSAAPVPNKSTRSAFALTEKPGDKIGRYKLREQIGEGGGGVVYVAEQEEPVRRHVALKILKLGMDTKSVIARFEAERQALALMDHPNIAKVFDAGATDTGRPYFVMELVRGIKITDFCDQNNLSTEERLRLFIQVCNAIQHAHQKGIIHRDIKPSNVLVTSHDGTPVPKVIDFGIAKLTSDQRLTDKTIYTAFQQFIGTPDYMSPEQAEMSGLDIDTRTDIYSLGVLLYELLTGETPLKVTILLKAGIDAMRETIRDKEPLRPSTRLNAMAQAHRTTIAADRKTKIAELIRFLRGDLDWIVMKALEKDRVRRYDNVTELGRDVERFLGHEAVTARPPSRIYSFRKMVHRNKAVVAIAGTLTIGLATSIWLLIRALGAERAQRQSQEETERAHILLGQQSAREGEARGLAQQRQLLEESRSIRLMSRSAGWSHQAWGFTRDAAKIRTSVNSNEVKNQAAAALAGLDAQPAMRFSEFGASAVLFDREGRRLLMGSLGDGARLWDGTTNFPTISAKSEPSPIAFVRGETPAQLLFDSKQQRFLLTPFANAQPIHEWRIPTGLGARIRSDAPPRQSAISREGSVAVAALELLEGIEAVVAFTSDSTTILSESTSNATSLAVSANGQMVATAESAGRVRVWDLFSGQRIAEMRIGRSAILCLALKSMPRIGETKSHDQTSASSWLLAAGDAGGNVTICDIRSQTIRSQCQGGLYQVSAVTFSPDGTMLASGGRGPVKLWDAATGRFLLDIPSGDFVEGLDFAPDGSRLAVSTRGFVHEPPSVLIWKLDSGRGIQTLHGLSAQIAKVCFSADGRRIAALSHKWEIGVWDMATGQLLRVFDAPVGQTADNAAIALSPSGDQLAFSAWKTATLWDVQSGRELAPWALPAGQVDVIAFQSQNRLLLLRTEILDGNANPKINPRVCRLRDLLGQEAAKSIAEIRDFNWHVFDAVMSPDGRFFVVAGIQAESNARRVLAKAFDSDSGRELWYRVLERTNGAGAMIVDATGKYVALQTNESAASIFIDLASGIVTDTLPWPPCGFDSKSGLYVSPGQPSIHERGCSLFFDRSETPAITFGIDRSIIYQVRIDPVGNHVAWGNADGTVTVCNLKEVNERLATAQLQW